MNIRVGQGFDIHPFGSEVSGSTVVLGGIPIPHERPLVGHSDADVLTHAIMDAVLGAVGLPDIGHFFPNTDPKYKNARSVDLLAEVVAKISTLGWTVSNVDSTLVCESPKIAPFLEQIKNILGERMGIASDDVGVKATTAEKLGSLGRGEGIAAMAVALLQKR